VDDAEIADGVNFHGDVVAGDDGLRRDVERFNAQAHAREHFDAPNDDIHGRALGFRQHATEAQNHAALQFLNDVQRFPDPDEYEADDDQSAYTEELEHVSPLSA